MTKKIEDFTIGEIISEILFLCVSYPQLAREVLQAIKSPRTIEEQVTNEDLRKLLKEWVLKSHGDEHAGQRLRVLIKTRLLPRTSQFMRGMTYPENTAGLCQFIVLVWLRAQLYPPSDSPHPKRMFYEASSTMLAMPAMSTRKQWKTEWMMAMERKKLLPPDAMKPNFVWTCENILPERVFRIQPCLWKHFPRKMFELIRDLLTHHLDGFILIFLEMKNHAMAATVKMREEYVTCKFFDPDALDAELAISLPSAQPESWEESIMELTHPATELLRIQPDADCTIVCLCRGSSLSSLSLTNWQEVRQIPPEKLALCLHSCLKGIGGRAGYYFNYIAKLINEISLISPEYLGMPSHGFTALFHAAQNGCEAVVDIILNAAHRLPRECAKLLLQPTKLDGATALFIAAQYGHDRTVSIILNEVYGLPEELAQILLWPRNDGITALCIAAYDGHKKVVEIILNAVFRLPPELAQRLLQRGFNGETALNIAAYRGHDGVVDAILNAVFIFGLLKLEFSEWLVQPTHNGTTALVMAILNRYERVVEIILDALPKLPPMLAKSLLQPRQGVSPVDIAQERGCSPSIIFKLKELKEQFKVS